MIFVTVGHQMPFDRLVRAVDDWAHTTGRTDVVAQIGESDYKPRAIRVARYLSPDEFDRHMDAAEAIIAHAGTGTIIAAVQRGKPLLVMPRLAKFGETRNDHQVATARHFATAGYVLAADTEYFLPERLTELFAFKPRAAITTHASPQLIQRIRAFVFEQR